MSRKSKRGGGRVISDRTAREVLLAEGVPPDFECDAGTGATTATLSEVDASWIANHGAKPSLDLDYIHRRLGGTDIYFVANRSNIWRESICSFRVARRAPELWDPVSGERRFAAAYSEHNGRTSVPLRFAPCGSWFVVFREAAAQHPPSAVGNSLNLQARAELAGAWTVKFDPRWGGASSTEFPELVSWTARPEPGIRYYSGTATYAKSFDCGAGLAEKGRRVWLDLGDVRELAEVRLNGKDLGVVWAPPFRVEVTGVLKPSGNSLEVEVVNFWPNRIIGDASLPQKQRLTRTNIRKLTKDTPLMESGLLGPVRLLGQKESTGGN